MWPFAVGIGFSWLVPSVVVVLMTLCVLRALRGERSPDRPAADPRRGGAVGWLLVAALAGAAAYGESSLLVASVRVVGGGSGVQLTVPDLTIGGPLSVGLLLAGLLATALPPLGRAPRPWVLPTVAVASGEVLTGLAVSPYRLGVQYVLLCAVGVLVLGGLAGLGVHRLAIGGAGRTGGTGRTGGAARTGDAWTGETGVPRAARWALLLPAVLVMAGNRFDFSGWQAPPPDSSAVTAVVLWLVGLLLVAGAWVAVVRSPRVSADVAALGLIGIGAYAVAQGVVNPSAIEVYRIGSAHLPPPDYRLMDQGHNLSVVGGIHGALLLAVGLWLLPRTVVPDIRRVLGREPDPALSARVRVLTETRAEAVSSAAAELRRIERDLHDGAQGRLVAIGMNLRAAEELMAADPEEATALIVEARHASAAALEELRGLVRGIYPPVLADRGLGEAVRALALDLPLPCETEIELPDRLDAPVESACYFAVAEVVTNAVRHAGARSLKIRAAVTDGLLRIEVTDDGAGGAAPAAGSGLAGVERRLAAFDGILAISSPPGGPTIVVMEVPCA